MPAPRSAGSWMNQFPRSTTRPAEHQTTSVHGPIAAKGNLTLLLPIPAYERASHRKEGASRHQTKPRRRAIPTNSRAEAFLCLQPASTGKVHGAGRDKNGDLVVLAGVQFQGARRGLLAPSRRKALHLDG